VAAQLTVKSSPAEKSWAEILGCKQRDFGRNLVSRTSLGYECNLKRNFGELAGVVAYFRERKITAKIIEELLFWVGFGLASWYRAHLRLLQ
jgi:hypothetical protein